MSIHQDVYRHAFLFLGKLLYLTHEFPLPEEIYSGSVWTCFYMCCKDDSKYRVCFIQYMVASDDNGIITFTLNPIPKLYNCPNCKTVFSVIAVLFYHVVGEKTIYKLKSCYKNQCGIWLLPELFSNKMDKSLQCGLMTHVCLNSLSSGKIIYYM